MFELKELEDARSLGGTHQSLRDYICSVEADKENQQSQGKSEASKVHHLSLMSRYLQNAAPANRAVSPHALKLCFDYSQSENRTAVDTVVIDDKASSVPRESLEEGFKAKSQQMESQLESLRGKIGQLEVKLGGHPSFAEADGRRSDSERRRFKDSKVQELYEKALKDASEPPELKLFQSFSELKTERSQAPQGKL